MRTLPRLAMLLCLPACGTSPGPPVPPAGVVAAVNRAIGHMDQHDNGAAIRELRGAVARAPGFYPGRFNLGLALTNLREDPRGAEEEIRAAIALEPREPGPRFLLGFLLSRALRIPRMEEASAAFAEAVRLAPMDPDAHIGLGVALGETGRAAEALREFEEAVRLAPRLGAAIYLRAMAWRTAGREEEAEAELRRYAALEQAREVDLREAIHGYEGALAEPVRDFARWLPPAALLEGPLEFHPAGPALEGGPALAMGDLDGDGIPDLVFGGKAAGWRRGLGGCGFGPPMPFPGDGTAGGDLALGDVDGDGRLDAAVAGVGVLLSCGSDPVVIPLPSAAGPGTWTFGDLDGDGDLDLVAGRGILLNDGKGRFDPPSAAEPPAGIRTHIPPPLPAGVLALGDVDGDGVEDALLRNPGGEAVLRRGASETLLAHGPALGAAFADLDGDRDLDLVLATRSGIEVHRNDGDAGPRMLALSLRGVLSPAGRKMGWTNARGVGARVSVSAGMLFATRTMGLEPASTVKPPPDLLYFGLGATGRAEVVSIRWPEGVLQGELDLPAGRATIEERQRKANW